VGSAGFDRVTSGGGREALGASPLPDVEIVNRKALGLNGRGARRWCRRARSGDS